MSCRSAVHASCLILQLWRRTLAPRREEFSRSYARTSQQKFHGLHSRWIHAQASANTVAGERFNRPCSVNVCISRPSRPHLCIIHFYYQVETIKPTRPYQPFFRRGSCRGRISSTSPNEESQTTARSRFIIAKFRVSELWRTVSHHGEILESVYQLSTLSNHIYTFLYTQTRPSHVSCRNWPSKS